MSQGITLILGHVLDTSAIRQAVDKVLTQTPGATSNLDAIILEPQAPMTPDIRIEQQRAFISFTFDARPGYHPNESGEEHLLFFPSGYFVDKETLRSVEQNLGGPIRSLIDLSYASDEGSQRLALLLADAVGEVSPLLVDMDWPEDSEPFTLAEVRALLATGDPNPIYQAWLAFKKHQDSL